MGTSALPYTLLDGQVTCARAGNALVMLFSVREWTLPLIDQLFEESEALGEPSPHVLLRHFGSEPGAMARRRLGERQAQFERRHPYAGENRTAMLTDSALTRGAMVAFSWLTAKQLRGFALAETAAAADWVAGGDGELLLSRYHDCVERRQGGCGSPLRSLKPTLLVPPMPVPVGPIRAPALSADGSDGRAAD